MLDLPRPELILFDWDNTLVDTSPIIALAMASTLAELNFPKFNEAEYKLALNMSLRERFPKLFGERWQEAREIYYAAYDFHSEHRLEAFVGAEAVIKYFYDLRVPMGLISNKRGDMLRKEVQLLGWGDYFIASTGAGDADADKPSGIIYREFLLASSMSEPQDFWMVGDSLTDMDFARAIKARGIFIGDINELPIDFADCINFDSVVDLPSLYKK